MLKVIGVGFGRTGTSSAKKALELLGFSPCHHMSELIDNQALSKKWHDVVFKQNRDWDDVFAGYNATLDWPAMEYWRELADYYPKAKLLLTIRDSNKWYESMVQTIFPQMNKELGEEGSAMWLRRTACIELIRDSRFKGKGLSDKAHTLDIFEKHNAEVKASFKSDRLLVWHVKDGWEPLCNFLEVAIPTSPFPQSNSTHEFPQMFASEEGNA